MLLTPPPSAVEGLLQSGNDHDGDLLATTVDHDERYRLAVHTKRYNKQIPGHHVQVDVKFLSFVGRNNSPIKR